MEGPCLYKKYFWPAVPTCILLLLIHRIKPLIVPPHTHTHIYKLTKTTINQSINKFTMAASTSVFLVPFMKINKHFDFPKWWSLIHWSIGNESKLLICKLQAFQREQASMGNRANDSPKTEYITAENRQLYKAERLPAERKLGTKFLSQSILQASASV